MLALIILVGAYTLAQPGLRNDGLVLSVIRKMSVSGDVGFHPPPPRQDPMLGAALQPSSPLPSTNTASQMAHLTMSTQVSSAVSASNASPSSLPGP